jgi:hypothetical protein
VELREKAARGLDPGGPPAHPPDEDGIQEFPWWQVQAVVHQKGIGTAGHRLLEQAHAAADPGGEELDFLFPSQPEAVGHVAVIVPDVAHEVVEKGCEIVYPSDRYTLTGCGNGVATAWRATRATTPGMRRI